MGSSQYKLILKKKIQARGRQYGEKRQGKKRLGKDGGKTGRRQGGDEGNKIIMMMLMHHYYYYYYKDNMARPIDYLN